MRAWSRGLRVTWTRAALVLGIAGTAIGIVVVVLFGWPTKADTVPRTSPVPATEDSLAIGAALYVKNCEVCHGAEGEGSELAADLTFHVPVLTDGSMFIRIRDGFPTKSEPKLMPAFRSQLTETERWHLVNFLRDKLGEGGFEPVIPEDLSRRSD